MYIYPDEDWRKFFNARRSSIILNLVVEPRKLVEKCASRQAIVKGQLFGSWSTLVGFFGIEQTQKCSIWRRRRELKKTAVWRFSLSKCVVSRGLWRENSTNQNRCTVALMWNIEFLHLLMAVNNNEIKLT